MAPVKNDGQRVMLQWTADLPTGESYVQLEDGSVWHTWASGSYLEPQLTGERRGVLVGGRHWET
jgi:hypothetical protein